LSPYLGAYLVSPWSFMSHASELIEHHPGAYR
jgi:hypothetical protein